MLCPPEAFKPLRALTLYAPLLAALGIGFMLWTHGVRPVSLVLSMTALIALIAGLLVQPAIWVAHWGVRFNVCASLCVVIVFLLPWSMMLAPLLSMPGWPLWGMSAVIATTQILTLALAAVYHAQRARLEPKQNVLHWPACDIDLRQRVVRKRWDASHGRAQLIAPALIGAMSVSLYHLLKTWLPEQGMVIVGTLLWQGIALWLCAVPLGRALGQSWRLHRIEQQGGPRFTTDRLAWFTSERQRSVWGRWWASRLS